MRIPHACVLIAMVVAVAGCGDGGGGNVTRPVGDVKVASIVPGATFSFDLGIVVNGKYFVTDRNNKSLDMVDVATHTITYITGTGANAFTGCKPNANCVGANNGISGPDGVNWIKGTNFLFVGDVDNVRIVDMTTSTVVGSIRVGTTGTRADEGCYDPDDHIYMISSPDADQPFASFINTDTRTVIATVNWVDTNGQPAGGNEQCQYDPGTKSFLVNNDNTVANPRGEVDVIPAVDIKNLAPGSTVNVFNLANVSRFPLGACDPTGMDLGPGTDMIVECRQGGAGENLTTIIMNRTNGSIVKTLPVGGGDQVAYDQRTNSYYVAANRWHASGMNDLGGGCNAANPCTPTLFVIDAASLAVHPQIATGNNAHSVAVDPVTGQIFVPYSSATAPAGCPSCAPNGFTDGGISVFTL
jgi:hypothetical protein